MELNTIAGSVDNINRFIADVAENKINIKINGVDAICKDAQACLLDAAREAECIWQIEETNNIDGTVTRYFFIEYELVDQTPDDVAEEWKRVSLLYPIIINIDIESDEVACIVDKGVIHTCIDR